MTRISQLRSGALALLLAIGSLTCGEPIGPTVATDIESVSGNGQTGRVGSVLPNPLTVSVTDESGNAVPGQSVSWVAQGGGSVSAATVRTGSDGRASVQRTLGPDAGEQTTTASVSGLTGSPVTFVATATEGPPTGGIVITTNPPTAALTGEVFDPAAQPAVRVTDAAGPAAGVEVTASLASGSGTLDGNDKATTNASGDAVFGDLGISGTGEHTLKFTAGTMTVTSSPIALSPLTAEATKGQWGPVVDWAIVPLHMSLLPNGKIFAWGKTDVADSMGMPRVWDPAQGPPSTATMIDVNEMLFCAGHTLMADGSLMIAGGHHMDDAGIKVTYFYGQNGSWTKGPDMANGRWYPTLTVLPNGNVLTMAGRNEAGTVVRTPELWNGAGWAQLTGAGQLEIPYYPRNFVDPIRNGQIFYAGERIMSRWFSYGALGGWTSGPQHIYRFNRDYGTAVMYDAGKILYAGGGGDLNWPSAGDARASAPTATAERIDLNQAAPQWQSAGSMSAPRRHLNSTILPDGQVLITGGTRGGGFVNIDPGLAVKEAEMWNPSTGQWTTLAANQVMRVYHSVSLLLPDGKVLHGASGDAMAAQPGGGVVPVPKEKNHEIFSPPYLFKSLTGSRPTITSAPASVGYGEAFSVVTPYAAQITDARWIRLGSVTHAFDMSQRANTLSFTRTATGVEITAPANPNLAPPGHYMLFILNRNGVPSEGKIIKVQ
jgi:galactose oxidase-like protein/Big-like domain-containing protein